MSVPESAGIAPSASEPEEAAAMVADDYTDIAVEAPVGRPFSMNLEAFALPHMRYGVPPQLPHRGVPVEPQCS